MAEYCRQCGAEQQKGIRYCTECGAPMDTEQARQDAPEYIGAPASSYDSYAQPAQPEQPSSYGQQGYAPPVYAPPAENSSYSQYGQYGQSAPVNESYTQEAPPHPDSPYAPVKMGAWVGINLLMLIPVVNLILLIVWACGGSKKINLKNYARGHLIVMAIQVVLSIILVAALAAVFSELIYEMGDLWDYFDYMNI